MAGPSATENAAEKIVATKASVSTPSGPTPVILDLGKHRRKRIKQLRRGEGRLMADVNDALEELRAAGTLSAASQPVVIIVRQKRRKLKSVFPLL